MSMTTTPRLALLLGAGLLFSTNAAAYEPKMTADGQPLRWTESAINVVIDPSLAELGPGAIEAATRAFAAWDAVRGSGAPVVTVIEGASDAVGYHANAENHCTIRFAPDGWDAAGGALAVTVVSYEPDGRIVDADIVINGGPTRPFAIIDEQEEEHEHVNAYDLESVLAHEAGHFFGLGENRDELGATMYPETGRGEVNKRDLSADDEAGLRYLYPNSTEILASCASRPGSTPEGGAGLGLIAVGMLLARRRR